jgi:hypothetical protein
MSLGDETVAEQRPGERQDTAGNSPARPARGSRERRLRQATRSAMVTAAIPTSRARMLPGFLIVGVQRCGTTSMFHALSQHPAVIGALLRRKEVHYFDIGYRRGMTWYQSHFPLRASARLAARSTGAAPVAFESGPYYMFHPLAPERIARDLPGVKLVVMLRDPASRTYSAYAHESALGYETESFERALELEPSRLQGEAERIIADPDYSSRSHQHHSYRSRGHYAEQLEQLERSFGRERIHVVDSGDFFAEPGPSYDGVLEFLGLPRHRPPVFGRHNARSRAPMDPAIKAELREYFRPHDERLAKWLGREPSWRR